MNQIISDFLQVGKLRFLSRGMMALRGFVIIVALGPYALGEYTIWLLYYFYFSMLDFGVQYALERDISHFRGEQNVKKIKETEDIGWSLFYLLTFISSVLLIIVGFGITKDLKMPSLVGLYVFFDRYFRSYDVKSRIMFRYKENEIAQTILVISSLIFICLLLPFFGISGIFIAFIASSILATLYLKSKTSIQFSWTFHWKKMFDYVLHALPLSAATYSIQLFHNIALTILALKLSKETLGYFAFAVRIFQIFLAMFPILIQDVIRTRVYYKAAESQNIQKGLKLISFPLISYSCIISIFWLVLYWWFDWLVLSVAPIYKDSIVAVKLLSISLIPLGAALVYSDYLASLVVNKTWSAIFAWLLGISFQVGCVYYLKINALNVMTLMPTIYILSTFIVYVFIASKFQQNHSLKEFIKIFNVFLPFSLVCFSIYFVQWLLNAFPVSNLLDNTFPFLLSLFLSGITITTFWIKIYEKEKTYFN